MKWLWLYKYLPHSKTHMHQSTTLCDRLVYQCFYYFRQTLWLGVYWHLPDVCLSHPTKEIPKKKTCWKSYSHFYNKRSSSNRIKCLENAHRRHFISRPSVKGPGLHEKNLSWSLLYSFKLQAPVNNSSTTQCLMTPYGDMNVGWTLV